jgi:hypothetical protein
MKSISCAMSFIYYRSYAYGYFALDKWPALDG